MAEGVPGKQQPGEAQSFDQAFQKIGNTYAQKDGKGASPYTAMSEAGWNARLAASDAQRAYNEALGVTQQPGMTAGQQNAASANLRMAQDSLLRAQGLSQGFDKSRDDQMVQMGNAAQQNKLNINLERNKAAIAADPSSLTPQNKLIYDLNVRASQGDQNAMNSLAIIEGLAGRLPPDVESSEFDPSTGKTVTKRTQSMASKAMENVSRGRIDDFMKKSGASSVVNKSTIETLLSQTKTSQGKNFNPVLARSSIRSKIIANLPEGVRSDAKVVGELDRMLGELVK
jgi:hypothetical protein